MIVLSRLDGSRLAVNADQIERLDEAQTTLVTMMNGNAYVVAESLDVVVDLVAEYQHRIRAGNVPAVRRRDRSSGRAHLSLADGETAPEGP